MKRDRYINKWLKQQARYEKYALKQFRTLFKTYASNIDWDKMTPKNYKKIIKAAITDKEAQKTFIRVWEKIGLTHGVLVGKGINIDATKAFQPTDFIDSFLKNVLEYFDVFGVNRITTIENTWFDTIVDFFLERSQEYEPFDETVKKIKKIVDKPTFYKWQSERIVRTEATGAANYATLEAGRISGYQMEKEWITHVDKRTRVKPKDHFDHAEMDGKVIPIDKTFDFNRGEGEYADRLQYPGDQTPPWGKAGNVINCRCGLAVRAMRDADGNILKATDPKPVIKPKENISKLRKIPAMERYEFRIKDQDYESAGVFDKYGNERFRKDGTKNQVSFTISEIGQMRTANAILTHNHPKGYAFSAADIRLMINANLSEIRAVTRYGKTYSMKPTEALSNYATYDEAIKDLMTAHRKADVLAKTSTDKWFYSHDNITDKVVQEANFRLYEEMMRFLAESEFGKKNLIYKIIK